MNKAKYHQIYKIIILYNLNSDLIITIILLFPFDDYENIILHKFIHQWMNNVLWNIIYKNIQRFIYNHDTVLWIEFIEILFDLLLCKISI